MLAAALLSLVLASTAFATPRHTVKRACCDISNANMTLPESQTSLAQPSTKPSFIALAIGTQNYTCNSAGTYTSVGAVAELFDISCLYNTPAFSTIQDVAFTLWNIAPPVLTSQSIINMLHGTDIPVILGQHYFVTNPITGVGTNPKWDFTSQGDFDGNGDAYVVAARVASLAAPTGPHDIDWVSLRSVAGSLASQVYRVDTRSGQPPASCTPGSPALTVKYACKYWLFGGSIQK